MKKIIASVTLLVSLASAGDSNTGCGFGYMVWGDNQDSTLKQVLAATTNGTSGSQTFGITSGTLGCDKPSTIAANDKLNNFVRDNMDKIALEAAQGNGENIKTLAKLMNVKDESLFASKLQKNFDTIFANDKITYSQVIDNIAQYAI